MRSRPRLLIVGGALVVSATAFAAPSCKPPSGSAEGTPDATASPQANAMPAPLAAPTVAASATVVAMPEGGPPPAPLRGDVALGPDTLGRETSVGYTLSAVLKPSDLGAAPRAPEVNNAGLEAARKKTELRLAIELGASRMRVGLLGSGWVVPPDTELRARADRYGHLVMWGGGATYRPLAPGSLRALLGERRFDVAPILSAEVVSKDDVAKRMGIRTRRVDVATRAAKATFELGRLPELGEAGALLCRLLLDLMNAPPSTALCAEGELPVRAELRWTSRGALGFELTGVLKRTDMPVSTLMVPPAAAVYAAAPLPVGGVQPALTPPELSAFRAGPVELPAGPPSNEPGLVAANTTDQLRVLHVDGIAVAWAAPGAKELVPGFVRGRYVVQWRTFLGDSFDPPALQSVPGLVQTGGPPDGGVKP